MAMGDRIVPRTWSGRTVALLIAALGACAGHEVPSEESILTPSILTARYPAVAAMLAEAAASPPMAVSDGFRVASASAAGPSRGLWHPISSGVTVDVSGTGDTSQIGVAGQARRIHVRRSGTAVNSEPARRPGAGAAAFIDGDAVVIPDAGQGIQALFFAQHRGVEELLVVREPRAEILYDFDLPPGFKLHRARAVPGLVEVRDPAGVPWIRMVARKGWDATGHEVAVDPVIEGARVRIAIAEPIEGPVAVDPEWQDARSPITARFSLTATLLPNGTILLAGGRDDRGMPLASAEIYDPITGSFADAGAMTTTRFQHTATLLPNGKVLFVGGNSTFDKVLQTMELYDPATGVFTATDAMASERTSHTATVLRDGKVFIAGGNDSSKDYSMPSFEVYDPEKEQFSQTGDLAIPRSVHTATLLLDGTVLIAGGWATQEPPAFEERYDPSTGDLTPAGALSGTHWLGTATLLPNGQVLVAAGFDQSDDPSSAAELYRPDSNDFIPIQGMTTARAFTSASLLPDGRVLIAGGEQVPVNDPSFMGTAEIYDPGTMTFSTQAMAGVISKHTATLLPTGRLFIAGLSPQLYGPIEGQLEAGDPPMENARGLHTATLLPNGDVLLVGGEGEGMTQQPEIFDFKATALQQPDDYDDVTYRRSRHAAVALANGQVLIAGGESNTVLSSAALYDPVTRRATEVTQPMTTARRSFTATLLSDGNVLIAGGLDAVEGMNGMIELRVHSSAELYDPIKREFTATKGPMSRARTRHTATLLPNGKVLIAGGTDDVVQAVDTSFSSAELFDPASGTFTDVPNIMNEERFDHTATTLPDGRVLLVGGRANNDNPELFDPITQLFSPTLEPADEARFDHRATLLPTGKVLITGGYTVPGPVALSSAELFDPVTGRFSAAGTLGTPRFYHSMTLLPSGDVFIAGGFVDINLQTATWEIWRDPSPANDLWRPLLDALTAYELTPGAAIDLGGERFTGISEASGSGVTSSPTNYPISLWMPIDGAPRLGALAPWSPTSATWTIPATPYPGPGMLFLVANGIRSIGAPATIRPAGQGIPCAGWAGACASGHCVDGVCCDGLCNGMCEACTQARKGDGADGECGAIVAGSDPDDECPETPPETCGTVGTCNGERICTLQVDSPSCEPLRCSPLGGVCLATCSSNLDCITGFVCTAGGACEPTPQDDTAEPGCSACAVGSRRAPALPAAAALALLCAVLGARRARRLLA